MRTVIRCLKRFSTARDHVRPRDGLPAEPSPALMLTEIGTLDVREGDLGPALNAVPRSVRAWVYDLDGGRLRPHRERTEHDRHVHRSHSMNIVFPWRIGQASGWKENAGQGSARLSPCAARPRRWLPRRTASRQGRDPIPPHGSCSSVRRKAGKSSCIPVGNTFDACPRPASSCGSNSRR